MRARLPRARAPGDRVALQVEKSIEAVFAFLGFPRAGAAFLPLNTAYTAPEIDYFLGDAEPAVFICDPARLAELAAIATARGVQHVLTLDADGAAPRPTPPTAPRRGFADADRGADDLAALLYTSGTTGRSKGAMLGHSNLASNALALVETWRFTPDDVLIRALPIFHTHGLFVAINVTLLAGSSMIFPLEVRPGPGRGADGARQRDDGRADLLYAAAQGSPAYRRHRLRGCGCSFPARRCRCWPRRIANGRPTDHAILERYGMTETGMNTSNPYAGDRVAGRVGFPLPGVEVRVVDPESGGELPARRDRHDRGEGPNVFFRLLADAGGRPLPNSATAGSSPAISA